MKNSASLLVIGDETVVCTGHSACRNGISIFPCEGEYPVYDDALYDVMNADELCEEMYIEAISKLVLDRTVLDIGTGRDANWAIAAARAGARRVYAVEELPEWARRSPASGREGRPIRGRDRHRRMFDRADSA